MFRNVFAFVFAYVVLATPLHAATFEFDIQIDAISGDGAGMGFFATGAVGDLGTGRAQISDMFPGDYQMTLENSLFQAVFPGTASAGSQFDATIAHDNIAGTVTVSGQLGGLTGPGGMTGFFSASDFEFVFTGMPSTSEFTSQSELESFLSKASMAGFVSAFLIPDDSDFETAFLQRIDFSAVPPAVPLPAGGFLLLSGIALYGFLRRRTA
ncbi:MAG: VPLPA-CTERM sorting domain-containing protein [Pseudomonadota bacterium]